jgi:hypothetical protein
MLPAFSLGYLQTARCPAVRCLWVCQACVACPLVLPSWLWLWQGLRDCGTDGAETCSERNSVGLVRSLDIHRKCWNLLKNFSFASTSTIEQRTTARLQIPLETDCIVTATVLKWMFCCQLALDVPSINFRCRLA